MSHANYSKYRNHLFICFILATCLYPAGIAFGKDKGTSNYNLIIIDKDNNSISIGGIKNDGTNKDSEISKETTINDMLIINNNDKIYIKHKSENENRNKKDDAQN